MISKTEFYKQWITALITKTLPSGRYISKGKDRLKSIINNSYCCLGVACCVAEENNMESMLEEDWAEYGHYVSYDENSPHSINNENPELAKFLDIDRPACDTIASLNDQFEGWPILHLIKNLAPDEIKKEMMDLYKETNNERG